MRLTTDLWVSAVLRRVFAAGGYGAVVKRGATEAGAVFIVRRGRDGKCDLYMPAPQSDYSSHNEERQFVLRGGNIDDDEIDSVMERELRFDNDLWMVELDVAETDMAEMIAITKPV